MIITDKLTSFEYGARPDLQDYAYNLLLAVSLKNSFEYIYADIYFNAQDLPQVIKYCKLVGLSEYWSYPKYAGAFGVNSTGHSHKTLEDFITHITKEISTKNTVIRSNP